MTVEIDCSTGKPRVSRFALVGGERDVLWNGSSNSKTTCSLAHGTQQQQWWAWDCGR